MSNSVRFGGIKLQLLRGFMTQAMDTSAASAEVGYCVLQPHTTVRCSLPVLSETVAYLFPARLLLASQCDATFGREQGQHCGGLGGGVRSIVSGGLGTCAF